MKKRDVHLINPFWNAAGGSELHALSLYNELKPFCNPHLWASGGTPDSLLQRQYPIKVLNPLRGSFPKTGTFVFIGVYGGVGRWFYATMPRRVILCYTTFDPDNVVLLINDLSSRPLGRLGKMFGLHNRVEIAYASQLLKNTLDVPGIIELSPFDTALFSPGPERSGGQAFVVGRLSRDHEEKHHPSDIPVYRSLVGAGCEVRLMGATYLAETLSSEPGITILPANAEPAHTFLQGLDCFYYGTSEHFTETFGRVVFEAMACELAVVCHNRGGYADFIRHGENGFLFSDRKEVMPLLLQLRDDPALRRRIGKSARETVLEMFSRENRKPIIDFYTR